MWARFSKPTWMGGLHAGEKITNLLKENTRTEAIRRD